MPNKGTCLSITFYNVLRFHFMKYSYISVLCSRFTTKRTPLTSWSTFPWKERQTSLKSGLENTRRWVWWTEGEWTTTSSRWTLTSRISFVKWTVCCRRNCALFMRQNHDEWFWDFYALHLHQVLFEMISLKRSLILMLTLQSFREWRFVGNG